MIDTKDNITHIVYTKVNNEWIEAQRIFTNQNSKNHLIDLWDNTMKGLFDYDGYTQYDWYVDIFTFSTTKHEFRQKELKK